MLSKRFNLGWAVLLLASCSLDERALNSQPGPVDSGATGGSGATDGNGTGGEDGGASGERASGEGLVDGCADLDTDGVPDCDVTLVENATFASGVEHWTVLGDARLTWETENALGDLPSGSAKLSAKQIRASAYQCAPLDGYKLVIAYASALVDAGADSEDPPEAELEVTFFQGDDCSGASDGYFETPPSAATDAWVTIQAGNLSKDTTRSVSVALVGVSADATAEFDVYFDNVMLKAQDP